MSGCFRAFLGFLLLGSAVVSYAQSAETLHCLKHGLLQEKQTYKDYTVRVFRESTSCFEIKKGNQRVFAEGARMMRYAVGSVYPDDPSTYPVKVGQSITGEGQPNLVIAGWTGGAHCCFLFEVFQIGGTFKKLAALDAKHGDLAHFEDSRHDGNFVFVTSDWTFAYWRAGFAQSPAPEIRLSFRDGRYRIAGDLMKQPAPSPERWAHDVSSIGDAPESNAEEKLPSPELWGKMLELIYSGHLELADKFLDDTWNPKWGSKNRFRHDFFAQLSQSPYWPEVRRLSQ